MKLVDILARELKVWPDALGHAVGQSADGTLHCEMEPAGTEIVWTSEKYTVCKKYISDCVTRAEWQAAVDALNLPKVVEWDGSGLPPVGIDCEMKKEKSWVLVKILAHVVDDPRFNPIAIYMEANDPSALVGQAVASRFRSVRTDEQVATEEREKAIKDLYYTINWDDDPKYWDDAVSVARKTDYAKAIDAGYTKVAK